MKLSILVVSKTYNLLNTLLKSLISATKIRNDSIEILVSWNGLDLDISLINKNLFENFFIKSLIPYHFASNMNELLDKASGEYLILVNDDVIFDVNCIDKGIDLFNSNSEIGLIGSRLRDTNFNLSHAGILFNLLHRPYHYLQGTIGFDHPILSEINYPVPAVTGALMLTKKQFLKSLRFNTNYSICGEDIEFCLDLREKYNKDIFYCSDFSGIHQAETTRSRDPRQFNTSQDNFLISRRYFRFIFKSNIFNLKQESKFVQSTLRSYRKFNINNFIEGKNRKWDLTLFLFGYYLKILIIIRNFFRI